MRCNYYFVYILSICVLIISCGDRSVTPTENTYRYGKNKGKVTFWTTFDQVNSNPIKIDIYDSNSNLVGTGFLSQYYNYGNEPRCDDEITNATFSIILKVGKYSNVAITRDGNRRAEGSFEIKEDACMRILLY